MNLLTSVILAALVIAIEAFGVRFALEFFTDYYISFFGAVVLVVTFNMLTYQFGKK